MTLFSLNSSILICPVCKESLIKFPHHYQCCHHHHFDLSKKGYLNLLLAHEKRSKNPGDSKEMVQARFDFLSKNHYKTVAETITHTLKNIDLKKAADSSLTIADIGCGTGYYLDEINKNFLLHPKELWGIDISKEAISMAARMYQKDIHWIVSSMKHLPFESRAVDIGLSIFAPLQITEINRILKKNGFFITVTPGAHHLAELRNQLFETVKEINAEKIQDKLRNIFTLVDSIPIRYTILLNQQNDIDHLVKMTPYYWKSCLQNRLKLQSVQKMQVTIDMMLHVFQNLK